MQRFSLICSNILDALFGTVRRTQWTIGGLVVVVLAANPAYTMQLFTVILQIAIMCGVMYWMIKKVFGASPKSGSAKKKSP
jgi:hypothetical protein